jgi:DNA repair ATPase RecN
MQVHIKNFQSIEDCKLEIPEKAFTCIVGPSNIGKSAIRRALECVFYNKSESTYIRKGSSECSVEVTFDDGLNIKWFRDDKTSRYEINGEKYSKLNKTVPEIITDRGIKELIINKEKFNVQVATQFSHIFLLDQTGSKVTEVLSNLGNLNKIITANKACLNDLKNNKSTLKVRKDDIVSLKEKINSFNGLDNQLNLINSLRNTLENLKNLNSKKEKALAINDKFQKSKVIVSNLKPVKDINLLDLNIDTNKFLELKKMCSKIEKTKNKIVCFDKLKNVKNDQFEIQIDIPKFLELKKIYNLIYKSNYKINYFKKLNEVKVPEFNLKYSDLEKIKSLYLKIIFHKESILKLRSDFKESEEKLQNMLDEKSTLLKQLKVCPLCDSNVG